MTHMTEADHRLIAAEVFGADKPRIGSFYTHAQHDAVASQELGYPVYRDVPYCCIRLKGERDFISQPVTDEHIAEFAEAWKLYQHALGQEQHSLKLLPKITPSVAYSLRDQGIHTIEQLAEATVPDAFADWQALARQWVRFWQNPKPRMRLVNGALEAA